MPTTDVASTPDDITRKDLTAAQVTFLKQSFTAEAADQGLNASFTETPQDNGEITLVIHFARITHAPMSLAAESPEGKLAWGSKVSADFRNKIRAIASKLGSDPNFMMAAIAFETGRSFSAAQSNDAGSGAVGLIQFMPSTAKDLGTTSAALAAMTAEDQLDFVEQYFARFAGKLHGISDVYMAILWPVAVSQPDTFVLFSQSVSPKVYQQNKGLDLNGDGKVTKAEAASKVAASLVEGLRPENVG
jgi:Transglycosylase SLT domain